MQHPIWPVTSLATLLALLLPVVCPGPAARAQASLSFNKLLVDPAGPVDPWGKTAGDLNNDGAIDLIVGGYKSGGLIWYQNPGWTPHFISRLAGFRTDHETGDIDQDGLLDVVSLGTDPKGKPWLGWFRNPWPAADWVASTIDNNTLHDIEIADLDDDGRIDVVGRNQEAFQPGQGDTLFIYTQTAPFVWSKFWIPCANGEGLRLGDVNKDARPDIIINGFWFENTGVGTAWITHQYTSTYTYRSVSIDIADIDADSLADIILSPSEPIGGIYRISWFRAPPDPTQEGWEENIIEDAVETVHHSIGAADFDNDGTMDIASAKMHSGSTTPEVKVFLNGGGGQVWTKHVIATTGSHGMRIIDVDNNGSKDLFGANWRGVQSEVWLNQPDTLSCSLLITDDGGGSQSLVFGLGQYATDSLDLVLREQELPAPPPMGQFDARFVGTGIGAQLGQGTHRDFRRGDSTTVGTRVHELLCQVGAGRDLTLAFNLPLSVSMRLQAFPAGGGIDTILRGNGSYKILDPGGPLSIVITAMYAFSRPGPPQLRSPKNGALDVDARPILSWDFVDYFIGYHVQVGFQGASTSTLVADTVVADTSLQLPVLDSLTTYWWKVSGMDSAGEGEFSAPWEFRTKEFVADPWTLGLWRMNEPDGPNVMDISLNANNGIAVGTEVVDGRFGTGREFNGTSDYIDLPESPSLSQPGQQLTTEAWLHLHSYPAGDDVGTVVSTGNQPYYELCVTSEGHLRGRLSTVSGPSDVEGRTTLSLDAWAHIAMTYDGSNVRLFVNGVLDAEQAHSGTIGGSLDPEDLAIGASSRDGSITDLLAGKLDEVRIFKVARQPGEFALQLPPLNLVATPGAGRVTLTWMNGGGGAPLSRYRIYRGDDSTATSLFDSTGTESYVDTTGVPFRTYVYRVAAVDLSGFEGVPSTFAPAAPLLGLPALVSPADGQSGVPIGASFVWKPVAAAEQYQLQVFMDSSLTQPAIDSTTADTMATMRGLVPEWTYWWRVRAYSVAGWGPYSVSRSFTVSIDSSVFTSTNLVANGGFEGGTSAWRYYQNGNGNAFSVVTTASVPEGTHEAMITLGSTIGTNNQIYQNGLMLEANTAYRITFAHHASAETRFRVRVIEQDDDYTEYGFGWKYVYPTSSVQTYTLDFTTANFTGPVSDAMVQFYFVRGTASRTIYLDDIVIVKAAGGLAKEGAEANVPLDVPGEFTLMQNYPNPFNPSTTIRYGVPEKATVRLEVFNTLGQEVATLVHGEQEAGFHEVQLDASGLAGGVYLYRLQAGDFVQTRKLLLLR